MLSPSCRQVRPSLRACCFCRMPATMPPLRAVGFDLEQLRAAAGARRRRCLWRARCAALHIAISDDDGRTGHGFREIYLGHRRNDTPSASGDRGTVYPLAACNEQGQIVVDPDWITATTAGSDFHDGLAQWSVYPHVGPAKRWWPARHTGSTWRHHPAGEGGRGCFFAAAAHWLAFGG